LICATSARHGGGKFSEWGVSQERGIPVTRRIHCKKRVTRGESVQDGLLPVTPRLARSLPKLSSSRSSKREEEEGYTKVEVYVRPNRFTGDMPAVRHARGKKGGFLGEIKNETRKTPEKETEIGKKNGPQPGIANRT